ncbi:MAG: 2-oxo acid dehydrogenase subunit E2 [Chloroflexales bacterium]|nr:2-oxo acid dehydrogenase subunit E2 [Chloroflexales bacterium]
MVTEIKMPQLGESVTEGTIGRWLKRPGEPVSRYEPLLEVVTDKVDSEVPAPVDGTLLEILVPEGETVRVGTVIARVGAVEASTEALAAGASATTKVASPAAPAAAAPPVANGAQGRNPFLSPVVARLVVEHGLDPAAIPGTGQGGRVTKHDVLRFIEARADGGKGLVVDAATAETQAAFEAPPPDVFTPPPPDAGTGPAPRREPLPADIPPVAGMAAPSAQPVTLPEDAELVPLSPMRRMIAEHMERSVRTAPHVTTVMEVDMGRVVAHREANRVAFERQGVRLTITPYVVQAVAAGLAQAPALNGSFTAQGIVLNRRIHIGVAVALDEGLLVPVVRDADEKNLLGLARAVGDLAERARSRRLLPDETQGGTFTVTNHGVTGSIFATPIINQPQAAILGVGAVVKRPVVISQTGIDAIAIRPVCYLSLTFDHRIADGAMADSFLAAVKRALEQYA